MHIITSSAQVNIIIPKLIYLNTLLSVGLTLKIKEIIFKKIMLREKLKEKMNIQSIRKARADPHAKRKPRPCGLTIHSAIGCPNKCAYCYIQDMGFDFIEAKPYGLTGRELIYALLSNPYFLPSKWGTFLAFGSISDPFNRNVTPKTMEYLKSIESLGNPCQFSTKAYISSETAYRLSKMKIPINPLVTIITIKKAIQIEPNAPPISKRLETIRNLSKNKLKTILFLRPIIPGVTDNEIEEIFKEAKRAGAIGVVIGGLRITKKIIERLKNSNINLKPILQRIKHKQISEKQAYIRTSDLKREAITRAKKHGLIPFNSACCANAYNANVPCINLCWLRGQCTKCPNNCPSKIPQVEEKDVQEIFRTITKRKTEKIDISPNKIQIKTDLSLKRREIEILKYNLQTIFRRKIKITK